MSKFYKKNHTLSFHYSTLQDKSQWFLRKMRLIGGILVVFGVILGQFGGANVKNVVATSHDAIASRDNYVSQNVNNFKFSDFSADYYLYQAEDGTSRLRVIEQFVAEFPSYDQNHGIIRVIPFTNQDGQNLTMESDSELKIRIKHNGMPEEPYDVSADDGYFKVTIKEPNAYVHGTQYYELEYEFRNVITEFADFQELYWDTNGNDWSQRFDKVTARLHIEDEDFAKLFDDKTSCYVGSFGATGQSRCEIRRTGEGYEFIAKDLGIGENLTFAVDFEPNTFTIPEPTKDYRYIIALIVQLAILAIVIALIIYNRSKVSDKRKFYRDYFIKPEYQPAKGFSVAEMSENYMSNTSDSTAMVATLIEMAVQGKVELVKLPDSKRKEEWKVHVKNTKDLTTWEINALQVLSGKEVDVRAGDEINIVKHTGTSKLLKLAQRFGNFVEKALKSKGLFEKDVKKDGGMLAVFGALWFIVGICALAILSDFETSYTVLVGGNALMIVNGFLCILVFVLCCGVGSLNEPYNKRTKLGLEYSRYMDGLKLYIKMAEADRLKFLQSVEGVDTSNEGIVKLYEKLLPYAIVFGLEKSWSKEMGHYYELSDVTAPTWYTSNSGFDALLFSSMLSSVTSSTKTSVDSGYSYSSSSGSSSSFSGGGGGGFSGGGGGGGGGGGC